MTVETRRAVAAGIYRIDPARSRLRFTATELLGLIKVRGSMAIRDGVVIVTADPKLSTVKATIDAASFRTDKPRRDRDVTGRSFLDAAAYPSMDFTGTALPSTANGWKVTGVLTVCNQPAEVVLDLGLCAPTVEGCRFTATARVDRYATGVTKGKGLIGRYVDVELDIFAVR